MSGTAWCGPGSSATTASRASRRFAQKVAAAIGGARTTQAQFDAMVSFAYNVGIRNLQDSTLLRKHKAGDFAGATAEFAGGTRRLAR